MLDLFGSPARPPRARVIHGDCLAVLPTLEECSVDAVVTDPPYHLLTTTERFGKEGSAPAQHGTDGAFVRMSRGFMNQIWDGGDVAFRPETWRAVMRVLKPGGHLLAFGGSRTHHRIACAIEDAGFEIRDSVYWCYGQGFPKGLNVALAIDKHLGYTPEVVGQRKKLQSYGQGVNNVYGEGPDKEGIQKIIVPVSDDAKKWAGWNVALKPAVEPICVARKPLSEDTVAANVLRWGTGGINVDACRIGTDVRVNPPGSTNPRTAMGNGWREDAQSTVAIGRWPANLVHDGSDEVLAVFPERHVNKPSSRGAGGQHGTYSPIAGQAELQSYETDGSAARFFAQCEFTDDERWSQNAADSVVNRVMYCPKAGKKDRVGVHPTQKPLKLMRWLVRLVTPPGGLVLDPFAGSGTTLRAAVDEGFRAVGIEQSAEYHADILRRMGEDA